MITLRSAHMYNVPHIIAKNHDERGLNVHLGVALGDCESPTPNKDDGEAG